MSCWKPSNKLLNRTRWWWWRQWRRRIKQFFPGFLGCRIVWIDEIRKSSTCDKFCKCNPHPLHKTHKILRSQTSLMFHCLVSFCFWSSFTVHLERSDIAILQFGISTFERDKEFIHSVISNVIATLANFVEPRINTGCFWFVLGKESA